MKSPRKRGKKGETVSVRNENSLLFNFLCKFTQEKEEKKKQFSLFPLFASQFEVN